MPVKAKPEGYHNVTPYLMVKGANQLIDFLKKAFDAQEVERFSMPDGSVMHAEVRVGDSIIMMGESGGKWEPRPSALYLYVDDVDAVFQRAVKAGGTVLNEPTNQFYGDRQAGVKDASGNIWFIATHVEDVSPEELRRRSEEAMKQRSK